MNAIARLSHPRSGDTQVHEKFLAPSADDQTRNYDREFSNHHLSPSTLRSKRLSGSKMKWWPIYTNFSVNALVRLSHPPSSDSQDQETFLEPSADNQTRNYDTTMTIHILLFSWPWLSMLREWDSLTMAFLGRYIYIYIYIYVHIYIKYRYI